jgi:uncharacterized protein (DUF1499 family)
VSLWQIPSILVLALLALGPLAAWSGAVGPGIGFRMFFAGAVLAALSGMGMAGAAAIASALGKPWRGRALRGAVVPLVAMLLVLAIPMLTGAPRTAFNDVTTDLEDPPPLASPGETDPSYPEHFVAMQREAFPDLGPIRTDESAPEAYAHALSVARGMPSWQIAADDPERGVIEATSSTRIFRFVDDLVIRVRPEAGGSRIDLRSRSRIGRGDLGANAARIEAFRAAYLESVAR